MTTHPIVSRPLQARFLAIPQAPLCYWLRERFFDLLAGRTLGDVADVPEGLGTRDDARFVRFVWEVPPVEWARAVRARRWVPFEKGGGYGKWFGHHFWAVDWEHDGARIKATPGPRVQNEQHYFKEGWTYSHVARGCLGFRFLEGTIIISDKSAGVIQRRGNPLGLAAGLSCRVSSFIGRSLTQSIDIREGAVGRLPLPERIPDSVSTYESACVALKRHLVALDPTERSFGGLRVRGASLTAAWNEHAREADAVAAVLHTIEGLSEREVFAAYGIDDDDLQAVLDETGTPAGWFPLLAGYDAVPELPEELEVPPEVLAPLERAERKTLSAGDLADLQRRLRALYEAGPGAREDEADDTSTSDEDDDDTDAATSGARIPIPTETFVEELSQKLEIHPISVYWLLRELREKDGVVSKPDLVRFVEDYLGVMVLRLLGHQWRREIERREPVPTWADKDGIIPLTEGTSEATLLARVRARLAEDFGPDRVSAVEREFHEITGRLLAAWLTSEFFKRHISQFKKRPIAWQLTSTPAGNHGKRRGRAASQGAPAFACVVYYHRLDADLLPKLRTQYIGPLRTSLQTELGALEKIPKRSADQDARRLELEGKLDELKVFDARVEQVIALGFASPTLDKVAANEPLDTWTSRDGRARAPDTRDAFLAQERRYDPDPNDGVRVNIAPLERAGLLATDVLAAKDVEKAIADRAQWRADERRWCREGKLPQPGWWKEQAR